MRVPPWPRIAIVLLMTVTPLSGCSSAARQFQARATEIDDEHQALIIPESAPLLVEQFKSEKTDPFQAHEGDFKARYRYALHRQVADSCSPAQPCSDRERELRLRKSHNEGVLRARDVEFHRMFDRSYSSTDLGPRPDAPLPPERDTSTTKPWGWLHDKVQQAIDAQTPEREDRRSYVEAGQIQCGKRPAPNPGCRIDECIAGAWTEVCSGSSSSRN